MRSRRLQNVVLEGAKRRLHPPPVALLLQKKRGR